MQIVAKVRDRVSKIAKRMGRALKLAFVLPLRALKSLSKKLLSLRSLFAGFIGFMIARRAFGFLTGIADDLDEIVKLSGKLQVTTKSLQELKFVAGLAGIEFSTLAKGVGTLQKNLQEARDGSTEYRDSFMALIGTMEDVPLGPSGKIDVIELLARMADGYKAIEDPIRRTAVAQIALGRAGKELGSLLEQGGDAVRAQANEIRKYLKVLSPAELARAAAFKDAMLRFQTALRGVAQTVFVDLAPKMTAFFESLAIQIGENRGRILAFLADIGKAFVRFFSLVFRGMIQLTAAVEKVTGKLGVALAPDVAAAMEVNRKQFQLTVDAVEAFLKRVENRNPLRELFGMETQTKLITLTGVKFDVRDMFPEGTPIDVMAEKLRKQLPMLQKQLDSFSKGVAAPLSTALTDSADKIIADLLAAAEKIVAGVNKAGSKVKSDLPPGLRIDLDERKEKAALAARQQEEGPRIDAQRQFLLLGEQTEAVRAKLAQLDALTKSINFGKMWIDGRISAAEYHAALQEIGRTSKRTVEKMGNDWSAFSATFADVASRQIDDYLSMGNAGARAANLMRSSLDRLSDTLVDVILGAKSAKEAFREFARAVLRDIAQLAVKYIVLGIAKSFAGVKFAKGGIAKGGVSDTLPVRSYAKGGVAKSPQVAIFGEAGEEAFVPLEGGRIPVQISGGGGGAVNFYITAMDSKDVTRVLIENSDTIWGVVGRGVSGGSRALSQQIRGRG
jgi:lambda family phage tail tape measure protein